MGKSIAACVLVAISAVAMPAEEWRGLMVEPENRCGPYECSVYHYSQSVELKIMERDCQVRRYTGHVFASRHESDIEHLVA